MSEPGEPGNGATSYALTSKAKSSDGKSKIKPAPLDLSQVELKERDKEQEKDETITVIRKGTKIGHRRIDEKGEITYKKQPSSALVSAIQLGIQYSVGRLSSKVERDVLMGDFYEIESVFFPSDGQQETPAHHYSDFRFKAYAPVAFRYFRELFHIAPDDFLISLCHDSLRELTNPGASGSLFYCSVDDQFIIKTVQHKEAEFLQKLLPGYYLNLNQNKRTLLPKFFGLYCYQCGGKNIRLVLMNNLLPSGYKIHLKYDLKGSTYKRKASKAERAKSSPTLKDLDFMNDYPDGISLDSDTYTAVTKTIQRDCRVLESFKIMDYSLLLAIHNVDEAAREKNEVRGEASSTTGTKTTEAASTNNEDRKASEKSTDEQVKGAHTASVARNPSARNRDDFAAYWEAIPQHRDDTPYGAIRARNSKGDRLLLFIGIIDILQSYRLKKRLEHGLKSVVQDADAISVHRPSFYAKRFQEFMSEKVFRKIPGTKAQITRSPSKKRASFNTGRGKERVRTSSDTDKQVHRVGDTSKSLASKAALSPSLDAGLANVVPGDVSFMGRETKSLDIMTEKSLPEPAHDLTTDTHDESTITHDESTITHDECTITHDGSAITYEDSTVTHEESSTISYEESTLDKESTTNEHSITGQAKEEPLLNNSKAQGTPETLFQGTPEHSKKIVDVKNTNDDNTQNISLVQGAVVFTVQNEHVAISNTSTDVPHTSDSVPSSSDDIPNTSDDVLNASDSTLDTSDFPNTTNSIPGGSGIITNISDDIPTATDDVPKISITTAEHVQEMSTDVSGNDEEGKSNRENGESFQRQSSTDSEPAVLDSKI